MSFELKIDDIGSKESRYETLLAQIEALIGDEDDSIANLANISAALKSTFGFWWVGFYIVKDDQLVLGPYQGPVACTRIALGKGVCGTAWMEDRTIVVEDVDQFPGHIACSAESKSEIVLPIKSGSKVCAVLDVDSEMVAHFNETDQIYLEKLVRIIEEKGIFNV